VLLAGDVAGVFSKGGASCQLLSAGVGLGVCAEQTRALAKASAATKKIVVFIAAQLDQCARDTRAEFWTGFTGFNRLSDWDP
jgi:hypothetical protein